jgi:glycosyltransferase involved in cell wall biosynthesis
MAASIAVVVKGYPRLSETFIAQELLALEQAGLRLLIVSLRHPTDPARHPIHDEIRAPVTYLPEYLHQEPARVAAGLLYAIRHRRFGRVAGLFFRDLRRDPTANRLRRLGQALVLARELPPSVTCIYAHYLHTPTSVARYAARLLGLRFAISAHAKDIWTTPAWEKREKLVDAAWVTTCTEMGFGHLHSLAPTARLLHLPHGVDLARLPRPPARDGATGVSPGQPIELVTVARAVEKKGLDTLLEALAMLPPTIHWRWRHIGAGPLQPCLRRQAEELGIDDRIEWLGATPHDAVVEALARADIFCLALRTAADGDRDGIPNVVAEAMSQGLPVVCTTGGAVAELVENGRTGLLVPAGDAVALGAAIARLVTDAGLRHALGATGRVVVETRFAAGAAQARLARELEALAEKNEVARCA